MLHKPPYSLPFLDGDLDKTKVLNFDSNGDSNLTKVLIKTLKASTQTRSAPASVARTSLPLDMACNDLEPSLSVASTHG
jgi:hypothetical protein